MAEIVKVQVPLNGDGPALIYGEGHAHREMVADLPTHVKKVMGSTFRAFFSAERVDGKWVLGERVADQDW